MRHNADCYFNVIRSVYALLFPLPPRVLCAHLLVMVRCSRPHVKRLQLLLQHLLERRIIQRAAALGATTDNLCTRAMKNTLNTNIVRTYGS